METHMKCGFIYRIFTKGLAPVIYEIDGAQKVLANNETKFGYYRQSMGSTGYFLEINIFSLEKRLIREGSDMIFDLNEIAGQIIALRGPASNNRGLPSKYSAYETWNRVNENTL